MSETEGSPNACEPGLKPGFFYDQSLGKSWLRRLNTLIPFCTLEQPVRDVQEESILTVGHREDSHES